MHRYLHHHCAIVLVVLASLAGAAHAQTVLGPDTPFHRFADELHPPAGMNPPIPPIGWDYWVTLQSGGLAINDVRVTVAKDNTFRLGDSIDLSKLSPDALGFVVAVDSVWGRNHHYVTTAGATNPADLRLSALPPSLAGEKQQRLRTVRVWLREVFKFPREFRSTPITLPAEGARLTFGVGFEDVLEQAGARRMGDALDGDGREFPSVRARVFAVADGAEKEIFAQNLTAQNKLPNHRRNYRFDADLSAFASKTLTFTFRFEAAGEQATLAPFALPTWANPVVHLAAPVSPKKNLLLISLDTLRADHVGAYGYARPTTPRLDQFAAGATLFEDCLSTSSWTTPAHASLFTGLSPILHGAGGPAGFHLRPSVVTLAELARANGYLTAAFTQGHAIGASFGFTQGFDQYSDGPDSGETPETTGRAEEIFAQAERWLGEFGGAPFVLFVHTYEIHAPYVPPDAYRGRFTREPPGDGNPAKMMSAADRERMIALYDEGIVYTDEVLGRFLDDLRTSGILDRTNVIIFSDHGEEFWEHGGVQHSFTLFQEQLHVPLIIRLAGDQPPAGRVPQRVILSDVFATSLDLLGIAHTPPRDSLNLVPLIRDHAAPYPRTLFRAELYKENLKFFMIAGIEGHQKYIARTQYDRPDSPLNKYILANVPLAEGELSLLDVLSNAAQPHPAVDEHYYDLNADAAELAPLRLDPTAQSLRRALLDDLQESAEEARQSAGAAAYPTELTEAERERLRALGYVE